MRKSWIIIALFIFSCKNDIDNKSFESSSINDNTNIEASILKDFDDKPNFNELSIIREKLQEIYDIIYLAQNNDDFELLKKSSASIKNKTLIDTIKLKDAPRISDLIQLKDQITINDTTKQILFKYIITSNNKKREDTLTAIITNQKIIIDNEENNTIKVEFKQVNY